MQLIDADRKIRYADAAAHHYHMFQVRKVSLLPYIVHPRQVARVVQAHSVSILENPDVVIAALLHDVIEDCDVSLSTLVTLFGEKVAYIVQAVSRINENKADMLRRLQDTNLHASEIWQVFLADKIANVQDIIYCFNHFHLSRQQAEGFVRQLDWACSVRTGTPLDIRNLLPSLHRQLDALIAQGYQAYYEWEKVHATSQGKEEEGVVA